MMKKPNFQTACDTCSHLRGAPAGRDERDTAWVYECFLDRSEFYESGDTCPEQEYRADRVVDEEYDPLDYEQTEKTKRRYDFGK